MRSRDLLLALVVALGGAGAAPAAALHVRFAFGGRTYDLPDEAAVLAVVYGPTWRDGFAWQVYEACTSDARTVEQLQRLLGGATDDVVVTVAYDDGTRDDGAAVVLPHERPEGLRSVAGSVVERVARTRCATSGDEAGKVAAFADGWARFNRSTVDDRTAIRPAAGSLDEQAANPEAVAAILHAVDDGGRRRGQVQQAFQATDVPSRTIDTFLFRYALDHPDDAARAARAYDRVTGFTASPEDLVLRFGPTAIEYAFDGRKPVDAATIDESTVLLGLSSDLSEP